ncbi:hypothetical protein JHK87_000256 [Glycine soja]|nr:hypothetical protein JHK87_000256 [Glycine soja]
MENYSRYVFGVTHIPRLEDWLVMPVERIGFTLMPHGFFNCSPAVDFPPSASDLDDKENGMSAKPIQNGMDNGIERCGACGDSNSRPSIIYDGVLH